LLREASVALHVAGRVDVEDAELIAALQRQVALERAVQRSMVDSVAALQRRGMFARHGQRPATALSDPLGLEPVEARRLVLAAEHVQPGVTAGTGSCRAGCRLRRPRSRQARPAAARADRRAPHDGPVAQRLHLAVQADAEVRRNAAAVSDDLRGCGRVSLTAAVVP
jgi:hypothetical protein